MGTQDENRSAAVPLDIAVVAARLGLQPDDVEPFGRHKGKLALGLEERLATRPGVRYIGVSAVSPTPLGEGKTVTAIGLAMAALPTRVSGNCDAPPTLARPCVRHQGRRCRRRARCEYSPPPTSTSISRAICMRSPPPTICSPHCSTTTSSGESTSTRPRDRHLAARLDVNDKGLAHIVTGLGDPSQAPLRETGFDLTAASEVMAILALATSFTDLRRRLGQILVGLNAAGEPVFAEQIGCRHPRRAAP